MSNPNKHNNPWGMELNQYCMLMHLSQFSGFFIPFGGIVIPIVMWYVNKDEYVEVDLHGKRIMNWIISSLIYTLIALSISIGILLLVALVVCSIVFIILGSTRSFKGEIYNYPMSINFIN